MRRSGLAAAVLLAALLLHCRPALGQGTIVAVFNFQMRSDSPDWRWLEKGLADQVTTSLAMGTKITVVARDEMQAVAAKVRWAAELAELAASDPNRMDEIRLQLKIDYLVTGFYSAQGDQIKITAQVIEMDGRKELARKEVSGAGTDILELQRKLSSELIGWFQEKPAQEVLSQLPRWTRSIQAVRALYEGMDLFDQGRYEEAWLKFRQASKDDGDYLEAQYWVARMYYFMDRYEHARRAYERFIYADPHHPRMGDAILEYLHTYEKLDAPPEELLSLYADFQRRFPDVIMPSSQDDRKLTASAWLRVRGAQLLQKNGRLAEAVQMCSAVLAECNRRWPTANWNSGVWSGWSWDVGYTSAQALNQLTGEVLMPKALAGRTDAWNQPSLLRFTTEQTELTVRHPARGLPQSQWHGRQRFDPLDAVYTVLAPDGYTLKKLTIYPFLEGNEGKANCYLNQYVHEDVTSENEVPVAEAARKGMVIADIPRGGIFHLVLWVVPGSPWRDPAIYYSGLRAVAELEKVGPHGNIQVFCTNASNFYTILDGRRARKDEGLIGLVPPGRHELQFRCGDWGNVFATCQVSVQVEANRTTEVAVELPFDPNRHMVGWTSCGLIGRDYPTGHPCLEYVVDSPSVQADEKAIRVFWTHEADIWQAVSTDGNSFSRPARLPMPVSTGWIEQSPLCFREESGRFLLALLSDRDEQHMMRPYVCWSRDALHWSRPAAILDRAVNKFDLVQDRQGRFFWADATNRKVTIMTSKDAYRWDKAASWELRGYERAIRLLAKGDGSYELFLVETQPPLQGKEMKKDDRLASCYSSRDGIEWSGPQEIRVFPQNSPSAQEGEISISAMEVAGETLVAFMEHQGRYEPFVAWARRDGEGKWEMSKRLNGIGSHCGMVAYHPLWGFLVCWRQPNYMGTSTFGNFARWESGPFLIRGKSVDNLFPPAGPVAPSPAASASAPAVQRAPGKEGPP